MNPSTVTREEWLHARKALLEREKELTHLRDAIAAQRRELPRVRIEKDYEFDSPDGRQTLADLFGPRSQLIVYHFMFGPGWTEGCKSCSYLADHFDGTLAHLAARDVALVAVSRGRLSEIEPFRARMAWRFPWVSSFGSSFNSDFCVSFTKEDLDAGPTFYNYELRPEQSEGEAPGLSVFSRDESGAIYHTYSCYARGLDPIVGTYQFLDLVPKGRDEEDLKFPMAWVRHHDRYVEGEAVNPNASYEAPKVRAALGR